MKSLLCIQSYAGAEARVNMLWPHLVHSGLDILGTCPVNSQHPWPSGCKFTPAIGTEDGWLTRNFLTRWVDLWEHLINCPDYSDYGAFLVTPFDVMFLDPAPEHPGGLVTHLAGWKLNQGEKAKWFFHPPWWADRASASVIVGKGRDLIRRNEWELCAPDVFLGLILEETNLSYSDPKVFSVGSGMMYQVMTDAVKAIKSGVWFVHGVANRSQMNAFLMARKKG